MKLSHETSGHSLSECHYVLQNLARSPINVNPEWTSTITSTGSNIKVKTRLMSGK